MKEERHAEEVQKKAKETVMNLFRMPMPTGAAPSQASGQSKKSKPFEMLSLGNSKVDEERIRRLRL